MDRRTRQLERRWRQTGDLFDHTRLLKLLNRSGLLEEKNLIAAAFLGHPASKLAMSEATRPRGVIFKGVLIYNVEIFQYIRGLSSWTSEVTERAALGVARLLVPQIQADNGQQKKLLQLEAAVKRDSQKARESLLRRSRQLRHNRHRYRQYAAYGSRQWRLTQIFVNICHTVSFKRNPVRHLIAASVEYKDRQIKEAIRKELYPFLLGEYR